MAADGFEADALFVKSPELYLGFRLRLGERVDGFRQFFLNASCASGSASRC
jgi:hypothetical protein